MSVAKSLYRAAQLHAGDAAAAFPLVNMLYPNLTMEGWRRFVRSNARLSPRRAGVTAIRDCRSYVHALFAYRIDDDITHGHILRLTLLAAGRLPGDALTQAIIARAEELAVEFGGVTIALHIPIDDLSNTEFEMIRSAGFQAGNVVMIRASQRHQASIGADPTP